MRITTRNRRNAYLLIAALLVSIQAAGCKSKDEVAVTHERSTSVSTAAGDSGNADTTLVQSNNADELQLPSVPDVGTQRTVQRTRKLPEEDEMDVRSPIEIKYIASSETAVRGARLFITAVDRDQNATVVHAFIQNEWGARTRLHPQPIKIQIAEDAMSGAKLLDDQTGRSLKADPTLAPTGIEVTRAADWTLKPADRQMLTLYFPAVPASSHSATLIIPGFATVTGVPLS